LRGATGNGQGSANYEQTPINQHKILPFPPVVCSDNAVSTKSFHINTTPDKEAFSGQFDPSQSNWRGGGKSATLAF
jgi:hypothetical protein